MRKLVYSIIPAALLAAPLALAAQPSQPKPPAPAVAKSAKTTVDQATLHKFAKAYEGLRQLRGKYMAKYEAASTATQRTAVKQQANDAMRKRITHYMPVAEYIRVSRVVSANTKVRERLISILKADMPKPARKAPPHGI